MTSDTTQDRRAQKALPVCVTLHQRDVDRLDEAAETLGVSRSAACRMAVRDFLSRVAPERLSRAEEGAACR